MMYNEDEILGAEVQTQNSKFISKFRSFSSKRWKRVEYDRRIRSEQ